MHVVVDYYYCSSMMGSQLPNDDDEHFPGAGERDDDHPPQLTNWHAHRCVSRGMEGVHPRRQMYRACPSNRNPHGRCDAAAAVDYLVSDPWLLLRLLLMLAKIVVVVVLLVQ